MIPRKTNVFPLPMSSIGLFFSCVDMCRFLWPTPSKPMSRKSDRISQDAEIVACCSPPPAHRDALFIRHRDRVTQRFNESKLYASPPHPLGPWRTGYVSSTFSLTY